MSRSRIDTIVSDNFDTNVLFFSIIAIVLTNFIVRLKILANQLNFDMEIIPYRTNLFTYYKLIWILFIALVLFIAFVYRYNKFKKRINFNYVFWGTGIVMLATILATLNSPLRGVHMWGLYSRTNGVLAYISLFLIIYLISNLNVQVKHIDFMVHFVNIVSIILVVIGIFQFFGVDMMNSSWFKQIYIPSKYRDLAENVNITLVGFGSSKFFSASSILGQFNYFGAFTSIIFPLITAFALNEDKVNRKVILIIGSIMLYIGTILAYSLGSIIAMLIVLLIIPIFLVNKRNCKSFLLMFIGYTISSAIINKLTKGIAFSEIYNISVQILSSRLVIIAVLATVLYVCLLILRSKISHYRYIIVTVSIILALLVLTIVYIYILENVVESNMSMFTNRGYIWHYSYELIKDGYIFGFGPDSLYYYFPQINTDGDIYMPGIFVDKPHNMYLQVVIDTGLIGLVGFLILLVGLLLKSNKAIDIEKDIYKNTYLKALMLVVAVYMIQGMVNDNHLTVQPIVYLIFGVGASLIRQTLDNAKATTVKK